jgi:hypothetical protein
MIQPLGEPHHGQPLSGSRRLVRRPADRFGDLHRGDCLGIGFLQGRIGARDLVDREIGGVAPRYDKDRHGDGEDHDQKADEDFGARFHG